MERYSGIFVPFRDPPRILHFFYVPRALVSLIWVREAMPENGHKDEAALVGEDEAEALGA